MSGLNVIVADTEANSLWSFPANADAPTSPVLISGSMAYPIAGYVPLEDGTALAWMDQSNELVRLDATRRLFEPIWQAPEGNQILEFYTPNAGLDAMISIVGPASPGTSRVSRLVTFDFDAESGELTPTIIDPLVTTESGESRLFLPPALLALGQDRFAYPTLRQTFQPFERFLQMRIYDAKAKTSTVTAEVQVTWNTHWPNIGQMRLVGRDDGGFLLLDQDAVAESQPSVWRFDASGTLVEIQTPPVPIKASGVSALYGNDAEPIAVLARHGFARWNDLSSTPTLVDVISDWAPTDGPRDLASDMGGSTALYADGDNDWLVANATRGGLHRIDGDSGATVSELVVSRGNGPAFEDILDIAGSEYDSKIYVLDAGLQGTRIISVDRATGNRELVSMIPSELRVEALMDYEPGEGFLLAETKATLHFVQHESLGTTVTSQSSLFWRLRPGSGALSPQLESLGTCFDLWALHSLDWTPTGDVLALRHPTINDLGCRITEGTVEGIHPREFPSSGSERVVVCIDIGVDEDHNAHRMEVFIDTDVDALPFASEGAIQFEYNSRQYESYPWKVEVLDPDGNMVAPVDEFLSPFNDNLLPGVRTDTTPNIRRTVPIRLDSRTRGRWTVREYNNYINISVPPPLMNIVASTRLVFKTGTGLILGAPDLDGNIIALHARPPRVVRYDSTGAPTSAIPLTPADGTPSVDALNFATDFALAPGAWEAFASASGVPEVYRIDLTTGVTTLVNDHRPEELDEPWIDDLAPRDRFRVMVMPEAPIDALTLRQQTRWVLR